MLRYIFLRAVRLAMNTSHQKRPALHTVLHRAGKGTLSRTATSTIGPDHSLKWPLLGHVDDWMPSSTTV